MIGLENEVHDFIIL